MKDINLMETLFVFTPEGKRELRYTINENAGEIIYHVGDGQIKAERKSDNSISIFRREGNILAPEGYYWANLLPSSPLFNDVEKHANEILKPL